MKKHKSVVAILLAVMMIFTMMPMMAFATTPTTDKDTVVWAANYQSVTVNGSAVPIKLVLDGDENGNAGGWTGLIHATTDTTGYVGSAADALPQVDAYFYDFGNAALDVGKVYTKGNFASLTSAVGIKLAVPSYVQKYAAAAQTYAAGKVINSPTSNWTWEPVVSPEFKSTDVSYVDRSFTLTLKMGRQGTDAADGSSAAKADIVGSVAAATVTVQADKAKAGDVNFFWDKETGDPASTKLTYDGAEHTVVANTVPGFTIAYSVLNTTTGKYDSVSAITVKDVATVNAKAVITDSKGAVADTRSLSLEVGKANAPTFAFTKDANVAKFSVKAGDKYDAYEWVEVVPNTANDQSKAAAKADAAKWAEFFKDYFEIKETPGKLDANKIDLSFAAKDLSDADTKALAEKYKALTDNYNAVSFTQTDSAKLEIVDPQDWYEIEFTKSPTTKTYKAKVLKKKAKSFKVHAESTNGEAVVYKLINAPEKIVINKTTGKITLKKGLKKGTYKITVRAYIPKTYDRGFWNPEEHNITIKVKK